MRTTHLALAALLMVCTASPSLAGQAPALSPASAAGLVHLDVTAVDAAGQPVRDLAVSEFEVVAGGQSVAIDSVTVVNLPIGPASPVVRGRLAPAQVTHDVLRNDDVVNRYLAIVLDDIVPAGAQAGVNSWIVTAGLDVARAFVEQLGPDDRGTVFFSFMGRQQGLTSDRERLLAAIDTFTRRQIMPADCQGSATLDGCLLDTLHRVAEALPVAPYQRKTVIVISERAGLPSVVPPADGTAPSTSAQRALQALQATNAVVYSITPASAGPAGPAVEGAVNLAEVTGGRALIDSTAKAATDAVWTESGAYYLLAVQPGAADGAYRRVSVRVTRPGVTASVRSGYFAPGGPAPTPPAGVTTPLEVAMVSPHQAAAVPMGASVAVLAVPGRREAVVSIATAVTSAAAPGASAWLAEVAATAFDPQWRPRASHRQTIEVTAPPVPGPQTVDVLSAIELLPGRYEIRVGGESAGRAGSVFLDVDVPEFQNAVLSASGAVVTTVPQPYAASPLLAQTLPVTPTTRRMFLRTETAEVLVRFYQGGRGRLRNLPVSLRIADADGDGIIQGSEVIPSSQFDAGRSTEWRLALPLSRLAPGDYLLTVEAELDDRPVTRHVRFSVMK